MWDDTKLRTTHKCRTTLIWRMTTKCGTTLYWVTTTEYGTTLNWRMTTDCLEDTELEDDNKIWDSTE